MPGIIVSDTSSLIILNKIGRLDLLKSLFGQIAITRIVSKEFNKTDFRLSQKLIEETKRRSGE